MSLAMVHGLARAKAEIIRAYRKMYGTEPDVEFTHAAALKLLAERSGGAQ